MDGGRIAGSKSKDHCQNGQGQKWQQAMRPLLYYQLHSIVPPFVIEPLIVL